MDLVDGAVPVSERCQVKLSKTMVKALLGWPSGVSWPTIDALKKRGLVEEFPGGGPQSSQLSERGAEEAFRLRGEKIVSWKAGVLTAGDHAFAFNGLRFATKIEASKYLCELSWRWTAVKACRVEPTTEAVTEKEGAA